MEEATLPVPRIWSVRSLRTLHRFPCAVAEGGEDGGGEAGY